MPTNKLTDRSIRSIKKAGRYSDGGGLYLRVRESGSKIFYFMTSRGGKSQEIAIGPYGQLPHEFTLANARMRRDELLNAVLSGNFLSRRTLAEKHENAEFATQEKVIPSFGEFASKCISEFEHEFKNLKHRKQWRSTLKKFCTTIWDTPVDQVSKEQVFRIIQEIWMTKQETATRLRSRIERILDIAKVQDLRDGENPAAWNGNLKLRLGKRQKLQRGHHAAMHYDDVPTFWCHLANSDAFSSYALRFLILTASRTGEVLEATWDEIDFDNKVWTIPAIRMKAGREHRVPLTEECMSILDLMTSYRMSDYVFPGAREGRPLSNASLAKPLKRYAADVTLHGFRSSFRDWAGEVTDHAREVAEAALAHRVGDATERAYRRGDALEKRRVLMDDWARFLSGRVIESKEAA